VVYGDQSYPFVGKAVAKWRQMNTAVNAQQVPGGHCFMQQYPKETAALMLQHWGFTL
jgi:surfactin synthase thioesterase subunit